MPELQRLRRAGGGALRLLVDLLPEDWDPRSGEEDVSITFADVEGYSDFVAAEGDEAAVAILRVLDEVVDAELADHRSARVVKRLGDGIMIVARHPAVALLVAVGLVTAFQARTAELGWPLRLRVGVHRGTVRRQGDDYFGYHVNLAARVAEAASGGSALATAHALAGVDLPASALVGHPAGTLQAKGVTSPVGLFLVTATDNPRMYADGDERATLAGLLGTARAVVAFTGAGISTESGIPDFRSPGGVWTRYDPRDFTFAKYVASAEVRARAWRMRREFWASEPEPNPGHRALAHLETEGRSPGVITQNIDGLHQAAGSRTVIELHGTSREVMCIGTSPRLGSPAGCGFSADTRWAFDALDAGEADPRCPQCTGIVKSATVSFGQNLFPGVIEAAAELLDGADLVLAVGSSLQVHPAAGLPAAAARAGVPLVIVNDEPTPLDELATLVVRGRAGEVLPTAVGL